MEEQVEGWVTLVVEEEKTGLEVVDSEVEVVGAVGTLGKALFLLVNGGEGREYLMVHRGAEALEGDLEVEVGDIEK